MGLVEDSIVCSILFEDLQKIYQQYPKMQVEGCICMGIRAVLFEKMDLKDNKLYPINYGAYKMALMNDLPKEFDVVLIEGADYPGPVGEPPLGPIGAANKNISST